MINFTDYIPQRKPFLYLDQVKDYTNSDIITEYTFKEDDPIFLGHFPNNPIVPGVLLCECCFQSGALLMGLQAKENESKTAVVTRIKETKFKNMAHPKEKLTIKVELIEILGDVAFMKGKITSNEKKIMTINFTCAYVS